KIQIRDERGEEREADQNVVRLLNGAAAAAEAEEHTSEECQRIRGGEREESQVGSKEPGMQVREDSGNASIRTERVENARHAGDRRERGADQGTADQRGGQASDAR